jgi:hypothetical protein
MAVVAIMPWSVSTADRLISAGNSVPSLRTAASAAPAPMALFLGWAK